VPGVYHFSSRGAGRIGGGTPSCSAKECDETSDCGELLASIDWLGLGSSR
jgi:hypothetical protein